MRKAVRMTEIKAEKAPVIEVKGLSHSYGSQLALSEIALDVKEGEIFGLVGPNGGGKTTLFRILSTLIWPTSGSISFLGFDLLKEPLRIRESLGVVFQSPAIDKTLSVNENLIHQGHLYGLRGRPLKERAFRLLSQVGLTDRSKDIVGTLSGGLKRRLEIARALLHLPKVLLLDEHSTGLDPLIRRDIWKCLETLRNQEGTTLLLSTHLLEEAEACDRIAFLHQGRCIGLGTPHELRSELGGDVLSIRTKSPEELRGKLETSLNLKVHLINDQVRLERSSAHELIPQILNSFGADIQSITLGKPTLEDVFVKKTGHRFWEDEIGG